VRVCIGKHLEEIYVERNDELYVDIFSSDKPSLLVRDPELEKNIVVKDFQHFMDRQISTDEKTDPLCSSTVFVLIVNVGTKSEQDLGRCFQLAKLRHVQFDGCQ
jgi:hypothetical protein